MGKELFKNIPSKVGDLVKDVRNGRIGLPDLQRPFVWRDNKVRELFDSMLKGYPIGYIMLWESPVDYESKKSTIGDNSKTYEEPKELVIDGQQRLTALVAAMFSVKVKDKNFADREIKISYNPLTREFAVWSQAYEKDTEWISRISDVFLAKEDNSISSLRRRFINSMHYRIAPFCSMNSWSCCAIVLNRSTSLMSRLIWALTAHWIYIAPIPEISYWWRWIL